MGTTAGGRVLRPDDAVRAVAAGVDGLVVSNHGGRRLDGMPATIDALPSVVAAVQGKTEIYLDGGIRRGTDVLKAVALGAKAVLIGRPYAWALAARGEEGVAHVLELLRAELVNAVSTCGCQNVSEIKPPSLTAPILKLDDGALAMSIETNKTYLDESKWKQRVVLMVSNDQGQSWSEMRVAGCDPTVCLPRKYCPAAIVPVPM